MPGKYLVINREKIQELNSTGNMLGLLTQEYINVGSQLQSLDSFINANWQALFQSGADGHLETSTGASLPLSKAVPIILLPNKMYAISPDGQPMEATGKNLDSPNLPKAGFVSVKTMITRVKNTDSPDDDPFIR